MISVAGFLCGETAFAAYLNDIFLLAWCCIKRDTPFLRPDKIFVSLSPTLQHFSTRIISVIAWLAVQEFFGMESRMWSCQHSRVDKPSGVN